MKTLLISLILFFFKLNPSIATANTYSIQWKSSQGTLTTTTGKLSIAEENGKRAIFILTKPPTAFQNATYIDDNDSPQKVDVSKEIADIPQLLITKSAGKILFETNDQSDLYEFSLIGQAPILTLDKNCDKLKVSYKMSGPKASIYPGYLSCTVKNFEIISVVFSSTSDANWLGSTIPISEGKGERWKVFIGSEVTSQDHWDLSWGQSDQKNTVRLSFKQNQNVVPTENRLLKFGVGLEYKSGFASKAALVEGSFTELRLPLHAELLPAKTKIYFVFNGYLPLTTLRKLNDRDVSISSYEIASGYRWKKKNFQFSSEIGYLFHSLSLAGIGVISTYAAPFIGGNAQYSLQKSIYSLDLQYSNTTSDGTFSEKILRFKIYPSFLNGRISFFYQTNSISSSKNNIDLSLNLNSVGTAYDF